MPFAKTRFHRNLTVTAVCAVCVACFQWVPTATASEIGQYIANQVDVTTYRHYLDDLLYTHLGDNRGRNGPEHDLARDNIVCTFESFGLDVELEPFEYQSETYYNVVATQWGTVHPGVEYVLGSHFDSANNPGADDDGSGVAGILEIARILSQYETEYTIRYIAFDLEERGMKGSEAYVEAHKVDDILGMIQLDMIGWDSGGYASEIVCETTSGPLATGLLLAMNEYGDGIAASIEHFSFGTSDHASFSNYGYLACLLIEENAYSNPCYHRSCDSVDTPDYIDYDYAVDNVRAVAGFIADKAIIRLSVSSQEGPCTPGTIGESDCNHNGIWDGCDIQHGYSEDTNANGIPDECEPRITLFVDSANCPGPGIGSESDPFCSIQAAFDSAANGIDSIINIQVADGTYIENLELGEKAVRLHSEHGPQDCTIDGHVDFLSDTPAGMQLVGFSITNGISCGIGSGIDISCEPTVAHCRITNPTGTGVRVAPSGFATCKPTFDHCTVTSCGFNGVTIDFYDRMTDLSEATFVNCIIAGNTEDGILLSVSGMEYPYRVNIDGCTIVANGSSGIAYDEWSFTLRITDSTIAGNGTDINGRYGGLRFRGTRLFMSRCVVTGNCSRFGGGLYFDGWGGWFKGCVFTGNTAQYGGGAYFSTSKATLTNCLIAGNSAEEDGGGALLRGPIGNPVPYIDRLDRCTIVGNTAAEGGGVHLWFGHTTLANAILWDNDAIDGPQMAIVDTYSSDPTTLSHVDIQGGEVGLYLDNADPPIWSPGNIDANPLFVGGPSGMWTGPGEYDSSSYQVTFTDASAVWADNELVGQYIRPDVTKPHLFPILGNTSDTITTWADWQANRAQASLIVADTRYEIHDYHLTALSPCIDAGDPVSGFGFEPEPDGGRVNMGVYGNTPEATCRASLYIEGYGTITKRRVSRTTYEYDLNVTMRNDSDSDATDVSVELLFVPENITIGTEPGQDRVDVGFVAGGDLVTSTDTFTITIDRRTPVASSAISWRVSYARDGELRDEMFTILLDQDDLDGTPSVPDDGRPKLPRDVQTNTLTSPNSFDVSEASRKTRRTRTPVGKTE